MTNLLSILACAAAVAMIVLAAVSVVMKATFPEIPWIAILGLRRAAVRIECGYWVVSRGVMYPTWVFWFGSQAWQRELVAIAIAQRNLPHRDYGSVDTKSTRNYANGSDCWPCDDSRRMFGKPTDTIPPSENTKKVIYG